MNTKGYLILAPCGTGKSTWIQNLSLQEKGRWVDGDDLLMGCGVKNRNYFWYDPACGLEREQITKVFEMYLSRGFHILYSGSPQYMHPDLLIIPNDDTRKERLLKRSLQRGFVPGKKRFEEESETYRKYASEGITTFWGEIPSPEVITSTIMSKVE